MSVIRPLYVQEASLLALGEGVDRLRAEIGEHVIKSISHAAVPDPESPTGIAYSAVLLLELPGEG